jgi:proteasome lid subunit RPN8/RPN11
VDGAVTLRLSNSLIEEIRREGEQAYPSECCGILAGRTGNVKEVLRLVPALNRRTDDPHRYLISPDDLRLIEARLRSSGQEVLGFYHSHPDHPAMPSAFDTEQAWPWYSYIIVGVDRGRAAELASWVLADDRSVMHPESIEVLNEV